MCSFTPSVFSVRDKKNRKKHARLKDISAASVVASSGKMSTTFTQSATRSSDIATVHARYYPPNQKRRHFARSGRHHSPARQRQTHRRNATLLAPARPPPPTATQTSAAPANNNYSAEFRSVALAFVVAGLWPGSLRFGSQFLVAAGLSLGSFFLIFSTVEFLFSRGRLDVRS